MSQLDKDKTRQAVREKYAKAATDIPGCACAPGCCTPDAADIQTLGEISGYSAEELAKGDGANLGLGCGNPTALAGLKEGQTVLDLGSGAGFDCFLAAGQVGESGRVIGVDMTPEMLSKARENALSGGFNTVEFRLGEIEHLPVADNSVDVVISNCVVNLSPDKAQVFREAWRVLKAGGKFAISDIVEITPLPPAIKEQVELYVGCIAGAAPLWEVLAMLEEAGFSRVNITTHPNSAAMIDSWYPDGGASNYVASVDIEAIK